MSYFQSPQAPAPSTETPKTDQAITKDGESVDVPFLDYRVESGKPYSVEYFDLGDHWDDGQGGFSPEVESIESYLKGMIESGRIDNSTNSVKERLKQIEKAVGVSKSDRTVVKMGKIAAYCEFLTKTDHIEDQSRKYAI